MKTRNWFTWIRPIESKLAYALFALIGLLLIAISLITESPDWCGYLKELLKELGIVVLAVFTVSLFYEIVVSRKYSERFLSNLKTEIEKGESNAATCANLGINKIYVTRDKFEIENPLSSTISTMTAGSELRIVAVSLFLIMSKSELIKEAIKKGAHLEFAIFDPSSKQEEFDKYAHLETSDIKSAINVFQKRIVDWIQQELEKASEKPMEKPKGTITLKFHTVTLFESLFYLKGINTEYCVWDLSFGRDTTNKRIFVLDPKKPLGKDLKERYDRIWDMSKVYFKYDGNAIKVDDLKTLPLIL